MANTYIHTLPDVLATDPNAYTILDYSNQFDEYVTAKVSLSSLSDFTTNAFLNTPQYNENLNATTWVNENSSNANFESIVIQASGILANTVIPISAVGDFNDVYEVKLQNKNSENLAKTQISIFNGNENSFFDFGILGENYSNINFTVAGGSNVSYVKTTNSSLALGTFGNDSDIVFFTGGPFLGNEKLIIKQTGNIGIREINPVYALTVNGSISSNSTIFDGFGNSTNWNSTFIYVSSVSANNNAVNTLISEISSNLVLKTGGTIFGPIFTTKTLTSLFVTDELVTKRYVDSLFFETTISGNFVPSLYYVKTEIDDFLLNPTSVYNTTCSLSSNWNSVYSNWFQNSSKFENLNTVVNQGSGAWYSVYSYINSTSALEEDQNETTTYVLNNSANINETRNIVGTLSSNWNSVYSTFNSLSSLEQESRNAFNSLSSRLVEGTTYVESNSSNIQGISNVVNSFSANSVQVNSFVNNNSSNVNSIYSHYNSNSAGFATRNYTEANFLPLSGGNVLGELFATQFGVGNTVIASTLGTVVRKMQIFDSNGNSIGFIPIYNSIT